jgi:hypothetical protein
LHDAFPLVQVITVAIGITIWGLGGRLAVPTRPRKVQEDE